ncbi:MAG: DUF427 domain-containing protein [Pseudomonadales bacterium]
MNQPAPGFSNHPNYRVDIAPADARLRILVGGQAIADTREALLVTETRHRPVWYLPMADVDAGVIRATETSTYCPFKGHASYWTVQVGDQVLEDVLWGYQDPYQECEPLRGYVSFYTDRVLLEIDGVSHSGPDSGPGRTR